MSRLLLDTTYLVDADRTGTGLDLIRDDEDIAIAAVTLAELRVGALLASGKRRTERLTFVDGLSSILSVIPYDVNVAEAHARLLGAARRQGRPRGAHDLIIAATAQAVERTVVTADRGAFSDFPGVAVRQYREAT